MVKIAIVFHSGYGHTAKIASLIEEGIKTVKGSEVKLFPIGSDINFLDDLDGFDTIIFGSPTYMGSVTAQFKLFADNSSGKWMAGNWRGKFAAAFTNSAGLSGDKLATLQYLSIFAAQHGMIWLNPGIKGAATSSGHGAKPEDINRLGGYLGLMTQSDNAPVENTPSTGDMETAKIFGSRIAELTYKFLVK
jgi:NAD(P)H dehydrogenase (quinone)